MKWGLVIASRAKRQFRRLSADERDGIDQAFSEMCDNPFQGDVKFLRGLDTMRRKGRRLADFVRIERGEETHRRNRHQTTRLDHLLGRIPFFLAARPGGRPRSTAWRIPPRAGAPLRVRVSALPGHDRCRVISCPSSGAVGPGSRRSRRRYADPPAAALLNRSRGREWAR